VKQYDKLDNGIIIAINVGHHPLYSVYTSMEADRLAQETGREGFRIIDGRLQALRKAGKIKANRQLKWGWEIV